MSDVELMLVIAECKNEIEHCDGDLRAKVLAAMNVAKDHWMVLDRDIQFRGAVGAVMAHYEKDSVEYARLAAEVEALKKLSAFFAAKQAGLSVSFPDGLEESTEKSGPIGLMGMWHKVTKDNPDR